MTTFAVTRDFGHPWTRQPGCDLLEVKASNGKALNSFIQNAEAKHWHIWITDTLSPCAVLYKPSGATAPWSDNPN